MDNRLKEIVGALLGTLGTVESAIGSPPIKTNSDIKFLLKLSGNVLQALGNALEADGQTNLSFEKLGDQIQAVGNLLVILGMMIQIDDETGQKIIITGNWLQAFGSFVALIDELVDRTEKGSEYSIIGNLLQGIGNSMQAISGSSQLYRKNETDQLDVLGNWVQAIGAKISLIGQMKEGGDAD